MERTFNHGMDWVMVTVLEVLDPETNAMVVSIDMSREEEEVCPPHPVLRSSKELDVPELIGAVQESCYDRLTCETCWEGVWRQFVIDFPRCSVFLNDTRHTDAQLLWRTLVDNCATEAIACQLVTLCTQGALADLYMGLRERLVRDLTQYHIVDGCAAYRLHLTAQPQRAGIRVEKALRLVELVEEAVPLADIVVTLQVQLHPTVVGVESYSLAGC